MGTQNFSKAPNQFAEGINPKYLEKGKGCYVWDVDGNKYLDTQMGNSSFIFGYNDKRILDAISNSSVDFLHSSKTNEIIRTIQDEYCSLEPQW